MEDGRFTQSRLLDFYGALLTDKQRECLELHYFDDLSLAEIAEQSGTSRQGVWDNIRRADAALCAIETKTGLVGRFSKQEKQLDTVRRLLESLRDMTDGEALETVRKALEVLGATEHREE